MRKLIPLLATAISLVCISIGWSATSSNSSSFSFTNPSDLNVNDSSTWNSISATLIGVEVNETFTSSSSVMNLQMFDGTQGTLNSVTFNINFTTSQIGGQVSGNELALAALEVDYSVTLAFENITAFNGDPSLTNSDPLNLNLTTNEFGGVGVSSYTTSSFSNNDQLDAVTGPDGNTTFQVNLDSSDAYTAIAAALGTVTLAGYSEYAGILTVTYDYTPIPEASTSLLLFSGVLVLGIFVYKRRKANSAIAF